MAKRKRAINTAEAMSDGVVLKTIDTLPYSSFKIVRNRYLLKQED